MKSIRLITALMALVILTACGSDNRSKHGYEFDAPAGWLEWSGEPLTVPGTILEAYRIPTATASGSFVIFRSLYMPETSAAQLLVQRKYLVLNLPSLELHEAKELTVGGKPAAFLEMTATGTGSSLLPTSLGKIVLPEDRKAMPTRRIWISIPRDQQGGTLEILFHCPENELDKLRSAWELALESFKA